VSLIEHALDKLRANNDTRGLERTSAADTGRHRNLRARFDPITVVNPNQRVVTIDEAALREARVLPPESEARRAADEYRTIKRNVIRSAFDDASQSTPSRQIVAVSSALPGDGKTHTCINLALSLAREKDHQVVLVDADVAKPHVSKLFGIEQDVGLLDALASDELMVRDLVLPTTTANLWLVSAGRQTEHSTELLASDRMREIATQLVKSFPEAIILFDAPPLLLTSEARALVAAAGQILLVVRFGVTPQQAVVEAIEATQEPERVKLIFNQVESSGFTNHYYGNWQAYGHTTE
jgi:protein-tyrosine kinase